MRLYYNVQKLDGQPSLVLEEKTWFALNQNLNGPRRFEIDELAKKAMLTPNGDGSYASGNGITTSQALKLIRSWGHEVNFNPEVII